MDYIVLSTLRAEILKDLLLSYDIACQYEKNFVKRMDSYPQWLHLNLDNLLIRFAIPKKHWLVHGPNHSRYSLNFLRHVGRTYGEGVESGWSVMNLAAMSTKEMAPATRTEALDSQWDAYNHLKRIGLGTFSILYPI